MHVYFAHWEAYDGYGKVVSRGRQIVNTLEPLDDGLLQQYEDSKLAKLLEQGLAVQQVMISNLNRLN
ncbi:hypothetical protein C7B61_07735 [filamentous cyanobacterium CCP1]|nr:hypothetical protein C7B76_15785 [filamentous cyanobacterium CCP2]PSB67139.1 hypothetical protein C7B61_07735 [filamentous cyanobacterium CCP1]